MKLELSRSLQRPNRQPDRKSFFSRFFNIDSTKIVEKKQVSLEEIQSKLNDLLAKFESEEDLFDQEKFDHYKEQINVVIQEQKELEKKHSIEQSPVCKHLEEMIYKTKQMKHLFIDGRRPWFFQQSSPFKLYNQDLSKGNEETDIKTINGNRIKRKKVIKKIRISQSGSMKLIEESNNADSEQLSTGMQPRFSELYSPSQTQRQLLINNDHEIRIFDFDSRLPQTQRNVKYSGMKVISEEPKLMNKFKQRYSMNTTTINHNLIIGSHRNKSAQTLRAPFSEYILQKLQTSRYSVNNQRGEQATNNGHKYQTPSNQHSQMQTLASTNNQMRIELSQIEQKINNQKQKRKQSAIPQTKLKLLQVKWSKNYPKQAMINI